MIRLVFKQRIQIDTRRQYVATAEAGVPYIMTNYHAGRSIPPQICAEQSPFEDFEPYAGQALGDRALAVLWLAGLGDTIALAPGLLSLQRRHPSARIDLLSIPSLYDILSSAGFSGGLLSYPATAAALSEYDYFLPLEQNSAHQDRLTLDRIDFLAKRLHQPPGPPPIRFRVDPAVRARMQLPPSTRTRVGVQVKSLSPIRSYPPDLLARLLAELVRREYQVYLLGQAGDCDVPSAPPLLHNHCGRTATFEETVALVEQMSVMICPDSYLMHLAGALSRPTVALMSTIPARLRTRHYPSIIALEPDISCGPCLAIEDARCPLGHASCAALRSPPLLPSAVIEAVEQAVATRSSSQPALP